jgi:hypothetical protein
MISAGNSMDMFNAGVVGGQTRSPVNAIGQAIRGTLEHAKARGLLQDQSLAQMGGSIAAAKYKDELTRQPRNVMFPNQGALPTIIRGYEGDVESNMSMPGMGNVIGGKMQQAQGGQVGGTYDFNPETGQIVSANTMDGFQVNPQVANPNGGVQLNVPQQQSYEFNSPQEADASGLPTGTVVMVGGRRYEI